MSRWRVRIGGAASPSGAGVLVDERWVLTCAHVVNSALGRPAEAVDLPTEDIPLDFPSVRDSATSGKVLPGCWIPVAPDGAGDSAVLTLVTAAPATAEPARLGATVNRGTEVHLFGHPRGYDLGVEVQAVLAGPGGPGGEWVQLEAPGVTGFRVQGGFSGAGVVDSRTGQVIGILVCEANDAVARVAWMQPVADVAGRCPALSLSVTHSPVSVLPAPSLVSVNTLPAPPSHFAGRGAELHLLRRAVTDGGDRLLVHAVTGMPGIGKTALALRFAYEQAELFPDAQLYIDLQGHSVGEQSLEPGTALSRLLRMIGVAPNPSPATTAEWTEVWRAELARRRAVVVLDNAGSSHQVRPLIPGASPSLVLLTSRRRLLDLEQVDELLLEGLPDQDALRLFTAVVGPRRIQAEPEAVAELILLCGQLPLAVRLVAAQLRAHPSWSVAAMMEAVRAERRLLQRLHLGRDVSVRTAFTLSYLQLDDADKALSRRLSLHPTTEFGAHAAAATADVSLPIARSILDRLNNDNLVQEVGWDRYRLHDLMREYLRERAVAEETEHQYRQTVVRSLDYYLHCALAARAAMLPFRPINDPVGNPPPTAPRLDNAHAAGAWFATEHANLVACAFSAEEYGLPGHAWRIPRAISHYLGLVSEVKDAARVLELGLAAAAAEGDRAGLAAIRTSTGELNYARGQVKAAVADFEIAADSVRQLGDRIALADLDNRIGRAWNVLGRRNDALSRHEQALNTFVELDDHYGQAESCYHLGAVLRGFGSYEAALERQGKAVGIYRELGYKFGEARSIEAIGIVHRLKSDYRAAVKFFDIALSIFQSYGDRRWVAHTWNNMASSLLLLGEVEQAKERVGDALATFRAVGNRMGEADALVVSGRVHRTMGQYHRSGADLRASLDLAIELGTPGGQANASLELAKTLSLTGETEEAIAACERSLSIYRDLDSARGVAISLLEMARCLHVAGHPEARARCELAVRACAQHSLSEEAAARELLTAIDRTN